jgi:hypothetical protein
MAIKAETSEVSHLKAAYKACYPSCTHYTGNNHRNTSNTLLGFGYLKWQRAIGNMLLRL